MRPPFQPEGGRSFLEADGLMFAPTMMTAVIAAAAANILEASAAEPALLPFRVVGDTAPDALGGLKGDKARGEEVIRDRRSGNCLICHSMPLADEPFQGDIGPDLAGTGARLSEGQVRLRLIDESILNPQTLMPPYYRAGRLNNVDPEYAGRPALTPQQLEDVTAYLVSLK
jgi:L-cysteine S-thiosulfotransferase